MKRIILALLVKHQQEGIPMRRPLIVIVALALFALTTAAPAVAGGAVPIHGTWGAEDFSEIVVDALPTSGEPGFLATINHHTNLGEATETVETPFSGLVFHGNGAISFQGQSRLDFGGGDVIHAQTTGVLTPSAPLWVKLRYEVTGGEGIYEGATGTIHVSQFGPGQSAFPPHGGFVRGVIKLN